MGMVAVARHGAKALALLAAGFAAGSVLAFVFISAGNYVGRSGSTGSEYWGYWDPASTWWFAWHHGGPLGALLLPVGYYRYLRRPRRRSLLHTGLVAAAVTLAGGVLGSLILAPLSAFSGSAAFLAYCKWVANGGRFRARPAEFVRHPTEVTSRAHSAGTPAGYDVHPWNDEPVQR